MIAAYCVNPAKASYKLEDLALDYLRAGIDPADPAASAWAVSEMVAELTAELKKQELLNLFEHIEMPLVYVSWVWKRTA